MQKVVKYYMDERTVERLNNDESLSQAFVEDLKSEMWSFTSDYGMQTEPLPWLRGCAIRANLQILFGDKGWREEDLTGEYVFVRTNAPDRYDGFGTLTIGPFDSKFRIVAIRREHFDWQTMRYRSGLHIVKKV